MRRIALISGGSSGIGEACVRLFAKDGWAVVFLCRTHHERAQTITTNCAGRGWTWRSASVILRIPSR